ncbi:MAG: alpha/beta hydrolase, partial [Rhizobacter sp.]
MHHNIVRVPGVLGTPTEEPARGITGLVYRSIRGVTRLVGGGIDAAFAPLVALLGDTSGASSAERDAVLAALNGVLGDHLAASGNPLAISMRLRSEGEPTGKILLLAHGLCLNDRQWRLEGHDHGAALAADAGFTPVYLHYNSGLSVSTNGRILAQSMERLYDAWPVPIERLVMVGHSMGGLVARSAIHHGALIQRGGLRWPARVNDLVCLGTPHQGAPLERAGQGVDLLLGAAPYAAPLARLGKVRSAGINDLRLGNIVSAPSGDDGTHRCAAVPLPEGTRCFAIAASLGPPTPSLKSKL